MRTCPGFAVGIGRSSSFRTSGPPGAYITAAFIVLMAKPLCHSLTKPSYLFAGQLCWRKTVAGDLKLPVSVFAKDEEFLISLPRCCTGGMIEGGSGRIGARKDPIFA